MHLFWSTRSPTKNPLKKSADCESWSLKWRRTALGIIPQPTLVEVQQWLRRRWLKCLSRQKQGIQETKRMKTHQSPHHLPSILLQLSSLPTKVTWMTNERFRKRLLTVNALIGMLHSLSALLKIMTTWLESSINSCSRLISKESWRDCHLRRHQDWRLDTTWSLSPNEREGGPVSLSMNYSIIIFKS